MIGPGARLGDDCVVHAHVSIRERVVLGHRVVVQDGAVLGSDGFGFVKQADGTHLKIPQHAAVVIEDDVEIGANTTIDRPAVGETRIRAGAKIDNLVQVAHGVSVGARALLAAQVGIAGSTVIEDDVVLAGQVGVAGHLRIGKGAIATAQTGIPNSLDAGEFVSGYPAIANREWLKASAVFRQLPALKKQIADLEARIAELEQKVHSIAETQEQNDSGRTGLCVLVFLCLGGVRGSGPDAASEARSGAGIARVPDAATTFTCRRTRSRATIRASRGRRISAAISIWSTTSAAAPTS